MICSTGTPVDALIRSAAWAGTDVTWVRSAAVVAGRFSPTAVRISPWVVRNRWLRYSSQESAPHRAARRGP